MEYINDKQFDKNFESIIKKIQIENKQFTVCYGEHEWLANYDCDFLNDHNDAC
jgi:hypothetical protein